MVIDPRKTNSIYEGFKNENVNKPFEILLVEDNKGDIGLITEFLSDAKVITNLHISEDGEEAIRFYTIRISF